MKLSNVLLAAWINALILAVFSYAWALQHYFPDVHYRTVQEDGTLEWATFWAFVLAAIVALFGAAWQRRARGVVPWCFVAIALFSLWVALEEISWGQRIIGYRAPDYFLEHNFQQELNLHNVLSTSMRKMGLLAVILSFGVVAPLLACWAPARSLFDRLALVYPPASLMPAFATMFLVYWVYPFRYVGEWVEFVLGLGFLFAMIVRAREWREECGVSWRAPNTVLVTGSLLVCLGTGALSATMLGVEDRDPRKIEQARVELRALERDFRSGRLLVRCGLHKRLYSYLIKFDQRYLLEGVFARLPNLADNDPRKRFLIDPWNSPYWLRTRCSNDRTRSTAFVYSFGPNRRRDSNAWELRADDLGTYLN